MADELGTEIEGELRVTLLGGFRVSVGDRAIDDAEWRLRKAKSLIKLLALADGHSLHREQVLDALWPDLESDAGTNNLHKTLYTVRRALDPGSTASGQFVHLQGELLSLTAPGKLWVDVEALETAVQHARESRTVADYQAALDLCSGDLLPEDRYEEWAVEPREELRQKHLDLLRDVASLQESAGDLPGAIGALNDLVAREPVDEDAHVRLMGLYASAGQRHQALRQFQRLRQALERELDAEAGAAAQLLYDQISAGEYRAVPAAQASEQRTEPQRSERSARPVIVGRDVEIEALEETLDGLLEGRGRLLLVAGAAGVGKSRLAREVGDRAARRGAIALWGAAYEQEKQLPYGPFVEALQTLVRNIPAAESREYFQDDLNELARLLPSDAARLGAERGSLHLEGLDRQRLFAAVGRFLGRVAARYPVVFVVDDLHAADEASLQLLHYLARTGANSPMLLVGTFRSEEALASDSLGELLPSLQREGLATRIDLGALDGQASTVLVSSLLENAPVDAEVFEALNELAEGNPLFLEEAVRSLREEGRLHQEGGRWQLQDGPSTVPSAIADLVVTRFNNLNTTSQQTLNLAAVIGQDISFQVLNAAATATEGELLDALDDALAHTVLEESDDGYRFTQTLQRAVLYQRLSRARRSSLHGQVATAIESLYGKRLDEFGAVLAHHYGLSLTPEKSVPHLLTAARHAASVYANEQAIGLFQDGIERLTGQDGSTGEVNLAVFYEELADVQRRIGAPQRSTGLFIEGMAAAADRGDMMSAMRLRGKAALSAMTAGDVDLASELLQGTLETLTALQPDDAVSGTYYLLSQLQWHSARHEEALETAERALEAAQSSGNVEEEARAYEAMALACHSLGDWQKGIEYELSRSELGVTGFDTDQAFDAHL